MNVNVYKLINIGLGVAVFGAATLLGRELILLKYKAPAASALSGSVPPSQAVRSPEDFSRLEKMSGSPLFGRSRVSLIQAQTAGAIQMAEGEVELLGTVVGPSGLSYAIFRSKRQKPLVVVAKGEKVFDAGVLSEILADRALVNANNIVLTFYMPQSKPPVGAAKGASLPSSGISMQTGEAEWVVDQKALEHVLSTGMGKLLTEARLLPYSEAGRTVGFRLSEVKTGGIFSTLGLKNGDVIMKVNGLQVDSVEKGVQLLSGLKGDTNVAIDLMRDGRAQRLQYQIR
ncbi:MAG: PDZ domain-containing protein [Deltaproteobacteria bacterium]|nr:PDZ domain-containing protein [Deltaproteobacteria bacterium]